MADRRNALERHLRLSEDDYKYDYHRRRALMDRVGNCLEQQEWAAAQVYALLLVAEKLDSKTSDVVLTNYDELANAIANDLTDDLRRIADANG